MVQKGLSKMRSSPSVASVGWRIPKNERCCMLPLGVITKYGWLLKSGGERRNPSCTPLGLLARWRYLPRGSAKARSPPVLGVVPGQIERGTVVAPRHGEAVVVGVAHPIQLVRMVERRAEGVPRRYRRPPPARAHARPSIAVTALRGVGMNAPRSLAVARLQRGGGGGVVE